MERQECRNKSAMKANVGDWLVTRDHNRVLGPAGAYHPEVHSADGSPPYVVRWPPPAMWRRWFPALTPLR